MKKMIQCKIIFVAISVLLAPIFSIAQPAIPIEQWKNKTILFIGAHPDDDASSHGLFAMLQENGNKVYVVLLTMGNVGTKDPNISEWDLAMIRKQEETDALKALGVPSDHYINLGYTDGMSEFDNDKEIVRRLVYWIRKLKPDVLAGFDPGYGFTYWNKTDHRKAAKLATDAARAAEWRLIYPGQIIYDNLEPWWVEEYLYFRGLPEFANVKLDVTPYVDKMIKAESSYVSQFSSGWYDYKGSKITDYPADEANAFIDKIKKRIHANDENGRTYEYFRYYNGKPDGIGDRRPNTGLADQKAAKKRNEQ